MPIALHRDIRKTLDGVVRKARIAAEDGAKVALRQLGVADAKRPSWLTPQQAELRVRLRAHARTLGDPLDTNDAARLPRLIREIAYAHWHRALFARFLLENGLLVDVEANNAPLRAADLAEIAEAEGRDIAEVAAEFAEPMLPEIFPKDDPVLALALPPETRQEIARLVDGLPAQTFKADDSLGWTYQFWQSDRKKQVNESEVKIGADELPAVTQLFTEDYMVLFLLENTLGAWWAGRKLAEAPELARTAADEDELRRKLALPDYEWTYLRFVRDEDGPWRPAAGTFPGWPETAAGITVLDPCMGSGHFLVFALAILVAFRKAEEGLDEEAAVLAVLRDNLHGLEIDPRCTQIAAFALALTAWKRIGGVKPLPKLNLACAGLSIGMGKAEFVRLAEKIAEAEGFAGGRADLLGRERNPLKERALARRRGGLERLYDLFAQAPVLGSLIDPRRALGDGTLFDEGFDGLAGVIGKVLDHVGGDPDVREATVTAQGLAKAAELLTKPFVLVATNVPYRRRADLSDALRGWLDREYPESSGNLGYSFMERILHMREENGTVAFVNLGNWLYIKSYSDLRRRIIGEERIDFIADVGPRGFSTITGEVVDVILGVFSSSMLSNHFSTTSARSIRLPEAKGAELRASEISVFAQRDQLNNPDARIVLSSEYSDERLLADYASAHVGLQNGDTPRFLFCFWEIPSLTLPWEPCQVPPGETLPAAGLSSVLRWDRDGRDIVEAGGYIKGVAAWGKAGVAVGQNFPFPKSLYFGTKFDQSCTVLIPKKADDLASLWNYCSSDEFAVAVRRIDKKRNVTTATFVKINVDFDAYRRTAAEAIADPFSNDPTQWLSDGRPRGSAGPDSADADGNPTRPGLAEHPLQVAVARLLGYRWPRQTGSSFMDCPAIDEPDEIDRSGRVDADGIVCLPSLHGEPPAAERLRGILQAAWGADWGEGVVRACLEAEGAPGDLDTWLADTFFEDHCKLFHQTPFVWHVWDGLRGGFSALVNCHKLCAPNGEGRRLLEKLRDTYLGEWIARQRRLVGEGDATAEDRLAAAEHLKVELTKIIEGEPPYDIFVRWKPLHRQPIGWEPDIDDGVRLNIRPFLTARPRNARGAKACILRARPGVKKHAGADRGGEPHRGKADYPWFWAEDHDVDTIDFAGGPVFKGRRYNDFHYTRGCKEAARAAKATASEAAE